MMADVLDKKQRVQAAFEARASSWSAGYLESDDFRNHNFLARRRMVLTLLLAHDHLHHVLDAGCGTGDYLPPLLERGLEVSALDAAAAMVEQVQVRFAHEASSMRVQQGDVEHMPYPAGAFDGVICVGVLEYLADDRQALVEIRRVLRPGGIAVVTVPNLLSPWMLLDIACYWACRAGGSVLDRLGVFDRLIGRSRANRIYRHRYHTPWQLDASLRQAGFRIAERRYCSFGSFTLGRYLPGAVRFSRWYERFERHPLLGLLGLNYVVKAIK